MLYTVQNAFGEVYGTYALPTDSELTAEQWAERLHEQLEDIEGINGITANKLLINSDTDEMADRVTIDIEPWEHSARTGRLVESERLYRVHQTIGMIARGEAFEVPMKRQNGRVHSFLSRIIRYPR